MSCKTAMIGKCHLPVNKKTKKGIQTEPPSTGKYFLESHMYRQNKTTNFLVTIFSQYSMVFNKFSYKAKSSKSQLRLKVNRRQKVNWKKVS